MMKKIMRQESGMTIVELMVSMVVSSFVIAGVYGVYTIQQRTYKVQEQVTEMQQRLRSTMDFLARDIRMAGSNPANESACSSSNNNKIIKMDAEEMIFNACNFEDKNHDQQADDTNYQITIWFDEANKKLKLKRDEGMDSPNDSPDTIANDVDAFNIEYFDKDGNAPATGNDVRSVRMSILIRSTYPDQQYKDTSTYAMDTAKTITFGPKDFKPGDENYHRRQLTSTIYLRNMVQ